ncbi:hypothetical protein [Cellulophaga sp. Ld12]|uniref:glycoside hydrolase family 16 protein n=1 Tax=Cellulophaga sp. Ld12 TaxID=3229535 RepID=UPI003865B291
MTAFLCLITKNSVLIISVVHKLIACSSATDKDESVQVVIGIVATCVGGIKNGSETAIDCGGVSCVPCVSGTVLLPESGYDAPESYEGYVLLWNDEFDASTLTNENWSFHKGNGCPNLCGWGNDELQYYTEKNHALKDGNLVITAKKENLEGYGYTSTRIHTADKFEFQYGRSLDSYQFNSVYTKVLKKILLRYIMCSPKSEKKIKLPGC